MKFAQLKPTSEFSKSINHHSKTGKVAKIKNEQLISQNNIKKERSSNINHTLNSSNHFITSSINPSHTYGSGEENAQIKLIDTPRSHLDSPNAIIKQLSGTDSAQQFLQQLLEQTYDDSKRNGCLIRCGGEGTVVSDNVLSETMSWAHKRNINVALLKPQDLIDPQQEHYHYVKGVKKTQMTDYGKVLKNGGMICLDLTSGVGLGNAGLTTTLYPLLDKTASDNKKIIVTVVIKASDLKQYGPDFIRRFTGGHLKIKTLTQPSTTPKVKIKTEDITNAIKKDSNLKQYLTTHSNHFSYLQGRREQEGLQGYHEISLDTKLPNFSKGLLQAPYNNRFIVVKNLNESQLKSVRNHVHRHNLRHGYNYQMLLLQGYTNEEKNNAKNKTLLFGNPPSTITTIPIYPNTLENNCLSLKHTSKIDLKTGMVSLGPVWDTASNTQPCLRLMGPISESQLTALLHLPQKLTIYYGCKDNLPKSFRDRLELDEEKETSEDKVKQQKPISLKKALKKTKQLVTTVITSDSNKATQYIRQTCNSKQSPILLHVGPENNINEFGYVIKEINSSSKSIKVELKPGLFHQALQQGRTIVVINPEQNPTFQRLFLPCLQSNPQLMQYGNCINLPNSGRLIVITAPSTETARYAQAPYTFQAPTLEQEQKVCQKVWNKLLTPNSDDEKTQSLQTESQAFKTFWSFAKTMQQDLPRTNQPLSQKEIADHLLTTYKLCYQLNNKLSKYALMLSCFESLKEHNPTAYAGLTQQLRNFMKISSDEHQQFLKKCASNPYQYRMQVLMHLLQGKMNINLKDIDLKHPLTQATVITLSGPPGVGKSHALKPLLNQKKDLVFRITVGPDTTYEQLFGTLDEPGPVRQWVRAQNQITESTKSQSILILEEANCLDPKIMAQLEQIIQDSGMQDGDQFRPVGRNHTLIITKNRDTDPGRHVHGLILNSHMLSYEMPKPSVLTQQVIHPFFKDTLKSLTVNTLKQTLYGPLLKFMNILTQTVPSLAISIRDYEQICLRCLHNYVNLQAQIDPTQRSPMDQNAELKRLQEALSHALYETLILGLPNKIKAKLIQALPSAQQSNFEPKIILHPKTEKLLQNFYAKHHLAATDTTCNITRLVCKALEVNQGNTAKIYHHFPNKGKSTLMIKGYPGTGKSSVVQAVLQDREIKQRFFNRQSLKVVHVGVNPEQAVLTVKSHLKQGHIIQLTETDLLPPGAWTKLNDDLAGISIKQSKRPLLIMDGNGSFIRDPLAPSQQNRSDASPALLNRAQKLYCDQPSEADLKKVLALFNTNDKNLNELFAFHLALESCLRQQGNTQRPTIVALLRASETTLLGRKKLSEIKQLYYGPYLDQIKNLSNLNEQSNQKLRQLQSPLQSAPQSPLQVDHGEIEQEDKNDDGNPENEFSIYKYHDILSKVVKLGAEPKSVIDKLFPFSKPKLRPTDHQVPQPSPNHLEQKSKDQVLQSSPDQFEQQVTNKFDFGYPTTTQRSEPHQTGAIQLTSRISSQASSGLNFGAFIKKPPIGNFDLRLPRYIADYRTVLKDLTGNQVSLNFKNQPSDVKETKSLVHRNITLTNIKLNSTLKSIVLQVPRGYQPVGSVKLSYSISSNKQPITVSGLSDKDLYQNNDGAYLLNLSTHYKTLSNANISSVQLSYSVVPDLNHDRNLCRIYSQQGGSMENTFTKQQFKIKKLLRQIAINKEKPHSATVKQLLNLYQKACDTSSKTEKIQLLIQIKELIKKHGTYDTKAQSLPIYQEQQNKNSEQPLWGTFSACMSTFLGQCQEFNLTLYILGRSLGLDLLLVAGRIADERGAINSDGHTYCELINVPQQQTQVLDIQLQTQTQPQTSDNFICVQPSIIETKSFIRTLKKYREMSHHANQQVIQSMLQLTQSDLKQLQSLGFVTMEISYGTQYVAKGTKINLDAALITPSTPYENPKGIVLQPQKKDLLIDLDTLNSTSLYELACLIPILHGSGFKVIFKHDHSYLQLPNRPMPITAYASAMNALLRKNTEQIHRDFNSVSSFSNMISLKSQAISQATAICLNIIQDKCETLLQDLKRKEFVENVNEKITLLVELGEMVKKIQGSPQLLPGYQFEFISDYIRIRSGATNHSRLQDNSSREMIQIWYDGTKKIYENIQFQPNGNFQDGTKGKKTVIWSDGTKEIYENIQFQPNGNFQDGTKGKKTVIWSNGHKNIYENIQFQPNDNFQDGTKGKKTMIWPDGSKEIYEGVLFQPNSQLKDGTKGKKTVIRPDGNKRIYEGVLFQPSGKIDSVANSG